MGLGRANCTLGPFGSVDLSPVHLLWSCCPRTVQYSDVGVERSNLLKTDCTKQKYTDQNITVAQPGFDFRRMRHPPRINSTNSFEKLLENLYKIC